MSENTQIHETNSTEQSVPIFSRFLLSLSECGKIFGPQASTLKELKSSTNVQISVTERQEGCSDRVLTCAGSVENIALAAKRIADLLIEFRKENSTPSSSDGTTGTATAAVEPVVRKYPFFFLNTLLPEPKLEEFLGAATLFDIISLRFILSNSQISAVMGKSGATIKRLSADHKVKVIVSRSFLPDSDDRIVEAQGTSEALYEFALDMLHIVSSDINIGQINERRYLPHVMSRAGGNSNSANNANNSSAERRDGYTVTVLVPERLVGSIMGTRGNRIVNLRKITRTNIDTGKQNNPEDTMQNENGELCRIFVIKGSSISNVKRAETLLKRNLDEEIARHSSRSEEKKREGEVVGDEEK